MTEVYKKGFYIVYDDESEDKLDKRELSIYLRRESLLEKILHNSMPKGRKKEYEDIMIHELDKMMSIDSRKILLYK